MVPQNMNSDYDVNELWFAKFFIGSMVAIAFLTVLLSFLPSPSGLRPQPQNKAAILPINSSQVLTSQLI